MTSRPLSYPFVRQRALVLAALCPMTNFDKRHFGTWLESNRQMYGIIFEVILVCCDFLASF